MRRSGAVLGVLALCACGEEALEIYLQVPDNADLGFAISVDPTGRFGAPIGPILFDSEIESSRVALFDGREADRVILVSWTHAALTEATRGRYVKERAADLELVTDDVQACRDLGGRVSSDGSLSTIDIPAQTRWTELDVPTGSAGTLGEDLVQLVRSSLSLRVPFEARRCGAPLTLEPFAAEATPLALGADLLGVPADAQHRHFLGAFPFDEDRMVVVSAEATYVFERGKEFVATQDNYLRATIPSGIKAVVQVEDPSVAGALVLAITGSNPPEQGAFGEIRYDGETLELTRSATVATSAFVAVVRNPEDGRLLAASNRGEVATISADWDGFVIVSEVQKPDGASPSLGITRISETPFMIGGAEVGSLLLGDRSGTVWTRPSSEGLEGLARYRAFRGRPLGGGFELWVGTAQGRLFRRSSDSSVWLEHSFRLGPGYECGAETSCGWRAHQGPFWQLRFAEIGDSDWLLAGVGECASLLMLALDQDCATYFPIPGRPFAPSTPDGTSGGETSYENISLHGELLTLVSNDGELYVLDLSPLR